MASETTINDLVAYYCGLLIIQYSQLPKAQATISLLVNNLLASAVYLDVLNGYDLADAEGVQLDILGKYAGVTRYYSSVIIENMFAFTDYSDPTPDAESKFGFSTYATFGGYADNGTLDYAKIIETTNSLTDSDFRILINLAIAKNNSNNSFTDIDTKLYNLFGLTIREESPGNMKMWYFIQGAATPLIQAILSNRALFEPMAVGVGVVFVTQQNVFAFSTYAQPAPLFGNGFSDYADYATLSGQILTYDVLQEG
jgi:hypothetical protein